MNQKLTKYAWLLPFFSGICWGATGIFVRTLEHDGLDNFSIISFRMLLAALITGIWILFYNRHLFYVHRRDFWLFRDYEEKDLLTNYLYSRFLTCEFNQIFKKRLVKALIT